MPILDNLVARSGLETTRVEGALDWILMDSGMTLVHSLTYLLPLVLSVHNEEVYQVAAEAPFGFEIVCTIS